MRCCVIIIFAKYVCLNVWYACVIIRRHYNDILDFLDEHKYCRLTLTILGFGQHEAYNPILDEAIVYVVNDAHVLRKHWNQNCSSSKYNTNTMCL